MKAELIQLTNRGMRQDESISKATNEYAFENVNIRIVATDENTQFTATSEKKPSEDALTLYLESSKPCNKVTVTSEQQFNPALKVITIEVQEPVDVQDGLIVDFSIKFTRLAPTVKSIIRNYTYTIPYGQTSYSFIIGVFDEDGVNTGIWNANITINYLSPKASNTYNYVTKDYIQPPTLTSLSGKYIGHCNTTDYCVVFTKSGSTNYIYRLRRDNNGKIYYRLLYSGNLGITNYVETTFYYESEDVQKVYWVDGKHVTRVINIITDLPYDSLNTVQFDFNPNIATLPTLNVTKSYDYSGIFAQGTIQYFITYYKKFGAETGIVQTSSINYISYNNRGAAADENVFCGFKIDISDIDHSFDYIRIYSAQRTSEDGPVTLKIVTEIEITDGINTASYVDLGTSGEIIDSNLLYYIGGQSIIAGTIEQKDDHMFLGDIQLTETAVSQDLKDAISALIGEDNDATQINFEYKSIPTPTFSGYYSHVQEINSTEKEIATFKRGELYRFAIQFMLKTGEWTAPYWVGDKECALAPQLNDDVYEVASAKFTWPSSFDALNLGEIYLGYRLLYAETSNATRKILAQGIVCPTLFNYEERANNEPYCLPSWNFRLRGSDSPWRHLQNIGSQYRDYAELQGVLSEKLPMYNVEVNTTLQNFRYYSLYFGLDPGHEIEAILIYYSIPNNNVNDFLNTTQDDTSTNVFLDYTDSDNLPINFNNNAYYVVRKVHTNKSNWSDAVDDIWSELKIAGGQLYKEITGVDPDPDKTYLPFSKNQLFSRKICRNLIDKRVGSHIWAAIGVAVAAAAAIAASVFTAGGTGIGFFATVGALLATAGTLSSATILTSIVAMGILGATGVCNELLKNKELDKVARKMASLGWMEAGNIEDTFDYISPKYENFNNKVTKDFSGGTFWVSGGQNVLFTEVLDNDIQDKGNQYYIDNSIISFHSPELDNIQDIVDNNTSLKFRIVGAVPTLAIKTDYVLNTELGYRRESKAILNNTDFDTPLTSYFIDNFSNNWLYMDAILDDVPNQKIDGTTDPDNNELGYYKIFLWNRRYASIAGLNSPYIFSNDNSIFGEINKKIFASQKYSPNTVYFDDEKFWEPESGIEAPRVYYDDKNAIALSNSYTDYKLYNANYDALIPSPYTKGYPLLVKGENGTDYTEDGINTTPGDPYWVYSDDDLLTTNPVRVKFGSTPHVVLEFSELEFSGEKEYNIKPILPRMYNESSLSLDFYDGNCTTEEWKGGAQYFTPWGTISDMGEYNTSGNKIYLLIDKNNSEVKKLYTMPSVDDSTDYLIDLLTELGIKNDDALEDDNPYTTRREDCEQYLRTYFFSNSCIIYYDAYDEVYTLVYKDFDPNSGYIKGKHIEDSSIIPDAINNISKAFSYFQTLCIDSSIINKQKNIVDVAANVKTYTKNSLCILNGPENIIYPILGGVPYLEDRLDEDNQVDGNYVYIGELYRDFDPDVDIYGGTQDYNLQQLKWDVCSDTTELATDITNTYGDTYYERWDCLKSYPQTEMDENGIVDILSFMVETHVNIDGRYDTHRGIHSIVNARPNNWNLINNSYSQQNNLIQYNILDTKYDLSRFKNQIVMSLAKSKVSNVDTWTNITTLAALDLNGKYGKVTELLNWKDNLLFFQESAVGMINFNNRTQISTEQGVPIEVANSGKLNGYSYIDNHSGAPSFRAVAGTSNGLYYVDALNRSFMTISDNRAVDLGMKAGMSVWFRNQEHLDKVRLDVDRLTNEILINPVYESWVTDEDQVEFGDNHTWILAFNEDLGNFTSFYDKYMFGVITNIRDKSIWLPNDAYTNSSSIYYLRDRNYYYPYSITYKVNPEPLIDKIFTNVEYIADILLDNAETVTLKNIPPFLSSEEPFDIMQVWNEYQNGATDLTNSEQILYPDNRRKFRIRRADIPRDETHFLDRIRNPWCFIQLYKDKDEDENKNEIPGILNFHSLLVKYYK